MQDTDVLASIESYYVLFLPRCGRSPIYRSREMAARALVPFIMIDQIPSTLCALLNSLPNSTDQCFRQNHIHGTLLQVSTTALCDFHRAPQDELLILVCS